MDGNNCSICTTQYDLEEQSINGKIWYRCKICTKLGRMLPIGNR